MASDLPGAVYASPAPAAAPAEPAVTWGAVFAGAVTTLAVAITLTEAAAGLGFTLGSPWLSSPAAATGFTPVTGAYAIVVQVLAFALGGYVTGRLRHVWTGLHRDEAHFRDTAHGLVSWAVATTGGVLLSALILNPLAERAAIAHIALAAAATPDAAATMAAQAQRSAELAGQSALFMSIGLLLSAFVSAVAAAIGGLRREEMHVRT